LADNPTFWTFVEKCADAIQVLNEAPHRYVFVPSHSGFSFPHNRVTLLPASGGWCIIVGDDDSLEVREGGISRRDIKTAEQLAAFVRDQLS
jgi:hypothetical protein